MTSWSCSAVLHMKIYAPFVLQVFSKADKVVMLCMTIMHLPCMVVRSQSGLAFLSIFWIKLKFVGHRSFQLCHWALNLIERLFVMLLVWNVFGAF